MDKIINKNALSVEQKTKESNNILYTDTLTQKASLDKELNLTGKDINKQVNSEILAQMGIKIFSRLDHFKIVENTTKYLVDKLIPFDRNTTKGIVLSGDSGTGKSIFAQNLAYAVSMDEAFLGEFKVYNPQLRSVLYISGEDGMDTNLENIYKQEEVWQTPSEKDNVHTVYGLDSIMDIDKLEDIFESVKNITGDYPCMVIIDSLSSFSGVEHLDTYKAGDIVKLQCALNRVASKCNCVPLWICHNKKKKESANKSLDVAGSYNIVAKSTQTINLEKIANEMDDSVYMSITKSNRMSDKDRKMTYTLHIDDNKIISLIDGEEVSPTKKEKYTDEYKKFIVAQCDSLLSRGNSWESIARELCYIDDQMSKEEKDKKIDSLSKKYRRWKNPQKTPNSLINSDKKDNQTFGQTQNP